MKTRRRAQSGERLTVAGLFAGIGGIELGLHRAGHQSIIVPEIDAATSSTSGVAR